MTLSYSNGAVDIKQLKLVSYLQNYKFLTRCNWDFFLLFIRYTKLSRQCFVTQNDKKNEKDMVSTLDFIKNFLITKNTAYCSFKFDIISFVY